MAPLLSKCNRAIFESDLYTKFAIPDSYNIIAGRKKKSDGNIEFNTNIRIKGNPDYSKEMKCPKDGWIHVDFNWDENDDFPVEISGIEYFSRVIGKQVDFPSVEGRAPEGNGLFEIMEIPEEEQVYFSGERLVVNDD